VDSVDDRLADLTAFLDRAPSPWACAGEARARLLTAGFEHLDEHDRWTDVAPRGMVQRGASLVAWSRAEGAPGGPVRIAAAHTDSPNLRIKPRPDLGGFGWKQLAVEVYGGVLLNSWLDRDLGVAGRVVLTDGSTVDVAVHEPLARIPQLAIHLDREVNERGLLLDRQVHLVPVWGSGASPGDFVDWLASRLAVARGDVSAFDLGLFDVTPAALLGADRSLLASGRLDNQVSCWAAVEALIAAEPPSTFTSIVALFDHEEVGSASTTGASGPLLEHVLERLALARGGDRAAFLAQLTRSTCISADNAHAVHPNYPERHEPGHRPIVNEGPAIKLNANQRYATAPTGVRLVEQVFTRAGAPWQVFVSRNNVPCGSTIGPLTATRLGIETVDVGIPQLSMHSARELCGTRDPLWLADALTTYLSAS
jgi:aspartyl aminopeptidase